VVRSCETDEQLKITRKSPANIDIGYKKSGATKQEVDNIKEDLQQRESDMQQAAERVKDRKQWKNFVHAAPSSATYG